ncbi:hypothetical protein Tco_0164668 [Tanacetum coccineum]
MAVLESCPKHNMVAYLEKTDGNAEFHEIIDFLTRSSIHHALTVTEPSVHKDPAFDELADDTVDTIESENAQDEGRTRSRVSEKKETADDDVSTEDVLSTNKEKVSTDRPNVSTDRPRVSTDREEVSTDKENVSTDAQTDEGTDDQTPPTTTTPSIFVDDETIAQVLLNMSQARAPLPKIDPKDKGKKKIEEEDESDSESDGIPEAEKKFKQLASDEEMARKIQEEWEEEEREQFTIEEREKFLHDTIDAQRKFLAQQRSEAIRNKPPTKNQLRNQMMTYLKHVGNFKHSDLKTKKFEEIQALYEKIKRSDEDFIAIGSAEDERMIKEMTEKGIDSSKDDSVMEKVKEEEGTKKRKSGHIKMIARKKPRSLKDVDSDKEHKRCLKNVIFENTIDTEVMENKWRRNQQDIFHLYDLMREQYSEVTLDVFALILWGDLKIMIESSTEGNELSDFWSGQQDRKIVTWRCLESCGVSYTES